MNFTELTTKELQDLKAKIELELKFRSDKEPSSMELLYENLRIELLDRLGSIPIIFPFFKKNNKAYYLKLKAVDVYLKNYLDKLVGENKWTLVTYNTFTSLYAKILADFIIEIGGSLTIETLINFKDYFPSRLDLCFPGYLDNPIFIKKLLGVK